MRDLTGRLLPFAVVSVLSVGCLQPTRVYEKSPSKSTSQPVVVATPAPVPTNGVTGGAMNFTSTGAAVGLTPSGRGLLVRRYDNGSTEAYLHVSGLPPTAVGATPVTYMAHVHALPCSLTDGGGHYKLDPSVATAVEANEMWFFLTPDATGVANATKITPGHIARPEAQSIVLHNPADAAKVTCLDLMPEASGATVLRGDFAPLTAQAVSGVAQIQRGQKQTSVTLWANQLAPATTYPAHVHMLPCAVTAGGGHYMINPGPSPSPVPNDPANELHLTFTTDANGVGSSQVIVRDYARPEAQSVVIHAADGSGTKIACADLSPLAPVSRTSTGELLRTPAAVAAGVKGSGTAKLTREPGGTAEISLKGMLPKVTYMAHVHNLPCRTGGGGHYKIDPSIAATVADNEIWLTITTDSNGVGKASAHVNAIPRPDAQSVVVHDPTTPTTRLLCADLD